MSLATTTLTNPYKFRARAAADQTGVASNTYTTVTLGTEDFDSNNNFASSTYTAPVTGYYQFNATVSFGSSVTGAIQGSGGIKLLKNGATSVSEIQAPFDNNVSYDSACVSTSDIIALTAADTIVMQAKTIVSSGTVTFTATSLTHLSGFLVSKL